MPLLAALLALGCAGTTLRSGKPPGEAAPGYDDHWHSAFFFGAVPYPANYDLGGVCPQGWSEVRIGKDPFTAVVGLVTLFVYSPSRLTIVCATPDAEHPPPLPNYTKDTRRR